MAKSNLSQIQDGPQRKRNAQTLYLLYRWKFLTGRPCRESYLIYGADQGTMARRKVPLCHEIFDAVPNEGCSRVRASHLKCKIKRDAEDRLELVLVLVIFETMYSFFFFFVSSIHDYVSRERNDYFVVIRLIYHKIEHIYFLINSFKCFIYMLRLD